MFTLNGGDTAGSQFLGGLNRTFVPGFRQDMQNMQENQNILQALSKINQDSSPLDIMKVLLTTRASQDKLNSVIGGLKDIASQRQAQQKQQADMSQVQKLATLYGLTPEEVEGLTPAQVVNVGKSRKQAAKFESLPDDLKQRLSAFTSREDYKNMTPSQIIDEGYALGLNPGIVDQLAKARAEEDKQKFDIHKDTAKYDEKLSDESRSAIKKKKALEEEGKLIKEIGWTDRIVTAVFGNSALGKLLKSPSAQQIEALALPLIEGFREVFGTRISDADLNLILQKIATPDKSPEVNKKIIEFGLLEAEMAIEREKIARQIKRENKNLRPVDYETQIKERLEEKFKNKLDSLSEELKDMANKQQSLKELPAIPQNHIRFIDSNGKYLDIPKNDKAAINAARKRNFEEVGVGVEKTNKLNNKLVVGD